MAQTKMTTFEAFVHAKASAGPVALHGRLLAAANRLEKKGFGRIVSNPGNAFRGPRIPAESKNGGYYVQQEWVFDQQTKSYIPNRNRTIANP